MRVPALFHPAQFIFGFVARFLDAEFRKMPELESGSFPDASLRVLHFALRNPRLDALLCNQTKPCHLVVPKVISGFSAFYNVLCEALWHLADSPFRVGGGRFETESKRVWVCTGAATG